MRDGELEIVTRHSPAAADAYAALTAHLHESFGAAVFSDDAGSIDEVVAGLLRAANATVATAESCTAGLLAGRLADVPGSSAYLLGGFVTYANEAKVAEVGVPQELLDTVGAVSAEVAEAMATGARDRLSTDYGIGITGVAGPDGGTADKPVGLVHVCLVVGDEVHPLRLMLGGSRAAIRQRTVVAALHLLRTTLAE
ncbi:MAG: nicotinamide-nucleotide amidohydrolase family protein [Nocardioides sp.]